MIDWNETNYSLKHLWILLTLDSTIVNRKKIFLFCFYLQGKKQRIFSMIKTM
jgi:hypothetical protein